MAASEATTTHLGFQGLVGVGGLLVGGGGWWGRGLGVGGGGGGLVGGEVDSFSILFNHPSFQKPDLSPTWVFDGWK